MGLHVYAEKSTQEKARRKADKVVLEAKIAAVWRWADAVGDGELGPTELQRLADRVGSNWNQAEGRVSTAEEMLAAEPDAVAGASPRENEEAAAPDAVAVEEGSAAAAAPRKSSSTSSSSSSPLPSPSSSSSAKVVSNSPLAS